MATYDITTTTVNGGDLEADDIINCPYSGKVQSIELLPGTYKLEAWGAQGGNTTYGGKGAYSCGIVHIPDLEVIYIRSGGMGAQGSQSVTVLGGFNGGGDCPSSVSWYSPYPQSGGGASDIRIGEDSLYARVIVAGGGGGSSGISGTGGYGGAAGGDASASNGTRWCCGYEGNGATQSKGGSGGAAGLTNGIYGGEDGSFGIGGSGSKAGSYNGGSGGGGGWYGGGGSSGGCGGSGGGGGSSYVYTESTASNYPAKCLLDSDYYLSDTSTIAGTSSILNYDGTTETGHSGNGYIRITVIECEDPEPKTYDITTDDIPEGKLKAQDVINCPYSGELKELTLTKGMYQLECWGAQGGSGKSGIGGKGGYSIGTLSLNDLTTLYLYSGGKGSTSDTLSKTSFLNIKGGFNGGGNVYTYGLGGSGGGASDIRIEEDSLYARVIVAGGGGGSGQDIIGGCAGGENGISIVSTSYNSSQTDGGDLYPSTWSCAAISSGTFGKGGNGSGNNNGGSGGGSGWYGGGGAGYTGGSAGGSGYVYTELTSHNYPKECLLNESYYLTDCSSISGNVSFISPNGTMEIGHSSDGYIRITVIEAERKSISSGGVYDITTDNINIKKIRKGDIFNCPYTGKSQSIEFPSGTYHLECWGAQGGYRSSSSSGGKGGYSIGTIKFEENTTLYLYSGGSGNSGGTSGGFNGGGARYSFNGGGGGTDIRINTDSLYARVIVAGGGGSDGSTSYVGTAGGGTDGIASSGGCGTNYGSGHQLYSGTSESTTVSAPGTSQYGGFGFGGYGAYYASGYGGSGGGGWYGGSGSYPDGSADDDMGGSGGSGYIYTESTYSSYPSNCLLNKSYYLSDASTIAGNLSFLSPDGATETGHIGDGYIRITVIAKSSSSSSTETKDIYDMTKDDINVSRLKYGDIINCPYSGFSKGIQLPKGTYKLECWGASGGDYDTTYLGGRGGYSCGTLTLNKKTQLYLYSGGQGSKITSVSTKVEGGFNGGGAAYTSSSSYYTATGGGATDIRIETDSLYARVIVAGAGGGGNRYGIGGSGGGLTGLTGLSSSTSYLPGTEGTQTSGGNSYYGTTLNNTSYFTLASFGIGSSGLTNVTSGGGSGWYGGGASRYGAAGGGSGYIYTSNTISDYPEGCLLNDSYYLTDSYTIDGTKSFLSPSSISETGHTGNGYIRITCLNVAPLYTAVKIDGVWRYVTAIYSRKNGEWN